MTDALISIEDLSLGFTGKDGQDRPILRNVSLHVAPGETVGIVGESGSGKSTVALAIMGYLKSGLRLFSGRAMFDGQDMFALPEAERARLRGGRIALIPQNAGQALTPTLKIGDQIDEALRLHTGLDAASRKPRVLELLSRVRLPSPDHMATRYPHELSGGQQQRVAIAMALAGEAKALLLDEPTTGLDVTTQAHILTFLESLSRDTGAAMIYVSHDLGVIARVADRIAVMYAGEIVELGAARSVLLQPGHPYPRALLGSIPRLGEAAIPAALPGFPPPVGSAMKGCFFAPRCPSADDRCWEEAPPVKTLDHGTARCWYAGEGDRSPPAATPRATRRTDATALAVADLAISYANPGLIDKLAGREPPPDTVSGVVFDLKRGETIGIVGESGSGKSTILRALAGLKSPKAGTMMLENAQPIPGKLATRDRDMIRRMQMIFQNADASLNPRHTVAEILAAPLSLYFGLSKQEAAQRSIELLDAVRLAPHYLGRYPAQLSGGEKQRVGIARAFAANPDIVLCDEVTSALDVSVQAAALALLDRLQSEQQTSYIFVSHDLAVVRAVADRIAVLYQGRICEIGPAEAVFAPPHHPYTAVLLGAVLEPDPDTKPALIADDVVERSPPAQGCPFQRRCPRRLGPECESDTPPSRIGVPEHAIHCHVPLDALLEGQEAR